MASTKIRRFGDRIREQNAEPAFLDIEENGDRFSGAPGGLREHCRGECGGTGAHRRRPPAGSSREMSCSPRLRPAPPHRHLHLEPAIPRGARIVHPTRPRTSSGLPGRPAGQSAHLPGVGFSFDTVGLSRNRWIFRYPGGCDRVADCFPCALYLQPIIAPQPFWPWCI